jgi:threonine/homoserine/homoserine lactone efflux protein
MQSIFILFGKSIAIGILASVPLGPVGVLCMQRTLSRGLLSGFISGMGAAVADALYAVVAILGLSVIINFIESQQLFMRAAGGVILLIVGIRIFYTNPVKQIRQGRKNTRNHFTDFLSILILMLTNPVAILLFIAAFASLELVKPDPGMLLAGIIITGILTGATMYWLIFNSLINHFRTRFRLRMLFSINRTAGSLIFIVGIVAIISGLF